MGNCPAGTYTIMALSLGEVFVVPRPAREAVSAGIAVGEEIAAGVTGAQLTISTSIRKRSIHNGDGFPSGRTGMGLRVITVSPFCKRRQNLSDFYYYKVILYHTYPIVLSALYPTRGMPMIPRNGSQPPQRYHFFQTLGDTKSDRNHITSSRNHHAGYDIA